MYYKYGLTAPGLISLVLSGIVPNEGEIAIVEGVESQLVDILYKHQKDPVVKKLKLTFENQGRRGIEEIAVGWTQFIESYSTKVGRIIGRGKSTHLIPHLNVPQDNESIQDYNFFKNLGAEVRVLERYKQI